MDRFWAKVDRSGGPESCWLWTAGMRVRNYGGFRIGRKWHLAHRIAWELTHGSIPEGLCVCHHCDNPTCCNPSHLFLGTIAENMKDRNTKGRCGASGPPGELNGCAKLTEQQVSEIRRLVAEGYTQRSVAHQFGISYAQVSRIHLNQRWKHLSEDPTSP